MNNDWNMTQLGIIADIVMGQSPDSSSYNTDEIGLPFLQGCADFGTRHPNPEIYCFPPLRVSEIDSILISVRAPVGKTNWGNQKYCIGRGLGSIRAKAGLANTHFLKHALNQNIHFLHRRSQGSTFLAIGSNDLKLFPIPDIPENTQRKIALILDTIDQAIKKTEALIHKYQQIKAGLMHDLFTRGLTADGKLRPPREQAPELYQETPIGWIPKAWGVAVMRDHGAIKLGRQRSPDKHSGKWTTPYLRVANVFDGFINFSDVLEMDFTPNEKNTFYVKYGDILLNEGQSLELVGRSSVYLGEDDKYCFQNTLVRFRCYKNHAPLFYGFLFKWWLDIGQFMQISKQTTSVAHLGADRFAKMPCPVLHYDEQLTITDRLSAIQKRIDCENNLLLKYQKQKTGLMHDLLTGKVPVKADQAETTHV